MTAHHQVMKDSADGSPLDVVVVGGSEPGLAMAWHLAQRGLCFVVLEAGPEVGHVWRSRWDSLKLFTPTQYDALPGMPFPAPADTYPTKDPVADCLQAYAAAFNLPVQLNARVTRLSQTDDGFEVRTADATWQVRQVVVVTGPFQIPFVPPPAAKLDACVTQVHSADYRNPQPLPEGTVLVVGGGDSGFQIAEELAATRQVDLSIAAAYPMLPQRLAGWDLFWWLTCLGPMRVTARSWLGRRVAARGEFVIGTNRRRLEREGVRFRPRLVDADGRTVRFADHSILEDVGVVVWATGYRPDYAWIHIPGVVREGHVVHRRGVTEVPGCTSLACPGSTPDARPCSASFTTTPPAWPTTLPPATEPPRRLPRASPSSRRPDHGSPCRASRSPTSSPEAGAGTRWLGRPERIQSCRSPSCSIRG